ncbi:MAG TPA: leucine--tRNA ligase [Candidatus Polarisedimenticolaceae bacterium]|nr:leucine--tRNA ligase [Candidatus Polarisedimenticolaceae bacterium]
MSQSYDPGAFEPRWQQRWLEERTFSARNPGDPGFDPGKPKYYVLDMFPYPSGSGLHVGHPIGYIGSDIVARRKRMEGFNVLHPMGWDAFGLPAEQYAITTGKHPAETTRENVDNFRRQLRLIGLSFDWDREFSTADPRYYRWTQWIFARLFDRGLVYQAEVPVWWCEELKTVLANEEVINGRSERGDFPCVRRPLKQWMLRITAYADRLVDDLALVDWPESVKAMQREWIGRSEGAEVRFPLQGIEDAFLEVFTTRPDTLWGVTYMAVAPEHPLVPRLTTPEQRAAVEAYVRAAAGKSDLDRTDLAKEKTGVFTGSHALHPLGGGMVARIPVYVADYVLLGYGTGAIMGVPGHDTRDLAFAQALDLPVVPVVQPPPGVAPEDGIGYVGDGTAVNSGPIDGLATPEAKKKTIALLQERGAGTPRVTYRLRDWLFSRQRYWGEPFPLMTREDGTVVRVPDADLPVRLPEMEDFTPSSDGSAPLARAREWVHTIDPETGSPATRATDTMPGWAGSCWYYLRFMDPHNDAAPFSPDAERYWGPVDLYIGGITHAVLHLLYARFWHKVLFDVGLVHTPEPFQKLFNQGLLGAAAYQDASGRWVHVSEVEEQDGRPKHRETGEPLSTVMTAMSKSKGNVVNPDDVIAEYGADTFRLYEMFMSGLGDARTWDSKGVVGCRRFLERAWRLYVDEEGGEPVRPSLDAAGDPSEAEEIERAFHRMLKRVDDSFHGFNFNTAVAAMMTFVNEASRRPGAFSRAHADRFARVMAPFAPHVAEELWTRLGHGTSIAHAPWPQVDPAYLTDDSFELVVQVLGKVRGRVQAPRAADEDALKRIAREAVATHLAGKTVVKEVVVPGRLVNFVVR